MVASTPLTMLAIATEPQPRGSGDGRRLSKSFKAPQPRDDGKNRQLCLPSPFQVGANGMVHRLRSVGPNGAQPRDDGEHRNYTFELPLRLVSKRTQVTANSLRLKPKDPWPRDGEDGSSGRSYKSATRAEVRFRKDNGRFSDPEPKPGPQPRDPGR